MPETKRLVVKVGSRLLTGKKGSLNKRLVGRIVAQIADLKSQGREILLVTSGAIAAGRQELGLRRKPRDLPALQAAAAVGQTVLMHIYHEYFGKAGLRVGQILLTRDGLHHRVRHLNVRHTLLALLEKGVIPIINENDSVAVDEIKFGDNDYLAALVANLVQADLLILLTDVEGLLEPAVHPDGPREVIHQVERVTPDILAMIENGYKEYSRGGMRSKIEAAEIVTRAGGRVVIAGGARPNVLTDIVAGEEVGTFFPTTFARMRARKSWIAFSRLQKGRIIVDGGARQALVERDKSLLASGVTGVDGDFQAGDMVSITGEEGKEFCRGLVNYSSRELEQIKGQKTGRIESILGYKYYDEVVHRDNLLIL
ncbi:MAG: glutamate 5-kinase [Candidatus Euphemobacter frigidus]|nr:glutamate 5-kinase [Candidatus Euphemobacter frigidus]